VDEQRGVFLIKTILIIIFSSAPKFKSFIQNCGDSKLLVFEFEGTLAAARRQKLQIVFCLSASSSTSQ
jgi:hypothetical protein